MPQAHVILLARDLRIRIVAAITGELLRELTLDPERDYQPTGAPKGPTRREPRNDKDRTSSGSGLSPIS